MQIRIDAEGAGTYVFCNNNPMTWTDPDGLADTSTSDYNRRVREEAYKIFYGKNNKLSVSQAIGLARVRVSGELIENAASAMAKKIGKENVDLLRWLANHPNARYSVWHDVNAPNIKDPSNPFSGLPKGSVSIHLKRQFPLGGTLMQHLRVVQADSTGLIDLPRSAPASPDAPEEETVPDIEYSKNGRGNTLKRSYAWRLEQPRNPKITSGANAAATAIGVLDTNVAAYQFNHSHYENLRFYGNKDGEFFLFGTYPGARATSLPESQAKDVMAMFIYVEED